MAFDHKQVFDALACAYRNGVLDKVMYIQGRAMELALEESGHDLVDLLSKVDETNDETVEIIEKILERSSLAVRLAANDSLMRLAAKILDINFINSFIININKVVIIKMIKTGSANVGNKNSSLKEDFQPSKGVI